MPGTNGNRVITYNPDPLGRIQSITYPDSLTETFDYDAIGNLTNQIDRAGRITRLTYLPARRLSSVTRGLPTQTNTIQHIYDQQFNSLVIRDPLDRPVEQYTLDIQDRPVQIMNVESQAMSIVYGLDDMVLKATRFDGSVISNQYNGDGRLSQVRYPSETITYTYLANGLPEILSDSSGSISNRYDGAGRLVQVDTTEAGRGYSVGYGLDPMGNATNIVASVGGINLVKKQTFDAANRLMRSDGPAGIFTNRYYIHNGLLSTVSNLASGLHVSYDFDIMDRVESIRWQDRQGEELFGMHYAYNAAGMITNLTLRDGSRMAYQYDSLDRLVGEKRYSATGTLVDEAGYDYDAAGNRLRKQRGNVQVNYSQPYGSQGNRLASWSATSTDAFTAARTWEISGHSSEEIGTNNLFGELWVSNTVAVTPTVAGTNFSVTALLMAPGEQSIVAAIRDTAGNMGYATNTVTTRIVTNANYTYNAAGCVTGILYRGIHYPDCQFNFAWNSQYQLTAVATNGTPVETYGYDPLGRRVWTSDGSVTNWHVYDGMHVVADLAASGTLLRSYAWGPGIDNLLAVTVYTGGTTNVYYAITDQLGTVHALADATGDIVESYLYDAWGNVLEVRDENGLLSNDNGLWYSPLGNRYLFQGREYSWATGLYNFRARWYDPVTGRWLSNDPIGISGGLNQYVAFENNPVNFRDWSGLCPDSRYESGEDYVRGYTDALFRDWWWAWAVPTIWAGHKDRDIAVHNEFADYWYRWKVWRSDQMGNIGAGYAFSCLVGPSLSLAICTVAEGVYAIGSRSTTEDAKASIELNYRGIGYSVKDGKASFGMYIISAPSMFFMMQPGR
jgi:RHS repeat-associated protein